MFALLMKEFGAVIGLKNLAPDVPDALTLTVDGQAVIFQYYEAGRELYIIHRIGTLPEGPKQRLAVQRFLLESNCFFRGVGPGAMGIENDDIFYTMRLSCCEASGQRIAGAELEHLFRAIVDTCAKLRRGCAEALEGGSPSAASDGMGLASMLRV